MDLLVLDPWLSWWGHHANSLGPLALSPPSSTSDLQWWLLTLSGPGASCCPHPKSTGSDVTSGPMLTGHPDVRGAGCQPVTVPHSPWLGATWKHWSP